MKGTLVFRCLVGTLISSVCLYFCSIALHLQSPVVYVIGGALSYSCSILGLRGSPFETSSSPVVSRLKSSGKLSLTATVLLCCITALYVLMALLIKEGIPKVEIDYFRYLIILDTVVLTAISLLLLISLILITMPFQWFALFIGIFSSLAVGHYLTLLLLHRNARE